MDKVKASYDMIAITGEMEAIERHLRVISLAPIDELTAQLETSYSRSAAVTISDIESHLSILKKKFSL